MRKLTNLLICILLVLFAYSNAQVGKICNWQDDKAAAVVLSFDDWSPGQFPIVLPALNARNLNATFFPETSLIASWNHDWPDVVTTANAGNEIGNHTVSHPNLTTKTAAELNTEIRGAKTTIDGHITNQKVVSFAYPLGAYNTTVIDSIKASGHICARTVNPPSGVYYTYNFATTVNDYYLLRTYPMSSSVSITSFTNEIKNVINGGGLLTYLYHSIDNATSSYNDNWYSRVLEDSLKRQMDTLVAKQSKIWVTTFGNSVKYHKEKRCATLSQVQAPSGTLWVVNLTDTLSNNSLYNHPLTIKLKMNSVAYDHVTQNGNSLTYSIIGDTIMFKAIPDGGQISLSVGSLATNFQSNLNESDLIISPNPTAGIVTLKSLNLTGEALLSLENTAGKVMWEQHLNAINEAQLDLTGNTPGVYYLRIQSEHGFLVKKIIFM